MWHIASFERTASKVASETAAACAVHRLKRHSIGDASRRGQLLPIANAVLIDVDASDPAAAACARWMAGPPEPLPTSSTWLCCAHLGLVGEPKPLGRGQPAALPDVLAEGLVPDGSLRATAEVAVDVVVEVDRSWTWQHLRSATRDVWP